MSGGQPIAPTVRTASGNEVSVQIIQDVYNSLTGKSERINNLYFESHCVEFSDFENLHNALEQAVEQYHCQVSNLIITVRYANGRSEKFSGFGKFKAQAMNKTSSTEEVEFQYDFMIMLPKTTEMKPYTVVVGVRSMLGAIDQIKSRNGSNAEIDIMLRFAPATARCVIDYVDLAVARALEAHVEEWYRGLRKLGGRSHRWTAQIAPFAEVLIRVLSFGFTAAALIYFLSPQVTSDSAFFRAIVISIGVFAAVRIMVFPISHVVERWLKLSSGHSSILLSNADRDLLAAYQRSPLIAWGKSAGSAVLAIICGVVSGALGSWLGF